MKRNTKKGFTIVELIIVIAVIAVLAAVLIPTFSNLIQKANEAKDTALVSDLNKGLKMSGKNFTTMHEALQAVEENVGINVAKISAAEIHSEILWDSANNCFVYLKNGATTPTYIPDSQKTTISEGESYKYWQILDKESDIPAPSAQKYSIYWNGGDLENEIEVKVGFDAGSAKVSVNYTGVTLAGKLEHPAVTIRTNGGDLTVNASADSVDHYGASDYINVKSIYTKSFHEYGVASVVRVEQGHFVAEATAKVINLNVASSDVKITETDGAKVVGYSKDNNDVTVKVNGTEKTVEEIKTAEDVKAEAANSEVIADGGVAEIDGIQFKTLQSAFDTAKDGQTVTMLQDIDLKSTLVFDDENAKSITLNANGKQLFNMEDLWKGNNWSLISVRNGSLTITGNGTFKAKADDCYAVDVQDGATLTIENGEFIGNIHAVYVIEGTAYINGGTYRVQQKYPDTAKKNEFVLNLKDEYGVAGTAHMYVTGGTFYGFNPSDCQAEGANTNFCVDGYDVAKDSNGEYIFEEVEISGENYKVYTVVKAN